jgi:hypothetical protein
MKKTEFDLAGGEVLLWDLADLDPQLPLVDQLYELKEDLAVVRYPCGIVVDVGYYPEFKKSGRFVVIVTNDADWDNPRFVFETQSIRELKNVLVVAIQVASNLASVCADER